MFLTRYAEKKNRRFQYLGKEAVEILENYPWPGNIRELQNTVERVVLLYDDIEVRPEHLRFLTEGGGDLASLSSRTSTLEPGKLRLPEQKLDLKALEEEIVEKALFKFDGNKTKTAEYLGLTRSALRSKLKE